jgi:YfiH family protein
VLDLATIVSVTSFPAAHGFTTIALGSMGLTGASDPDLVMQRRQQLAEQVGFDLGLALFTVQEHGANVVTFHRGQPQGGQCILSTDALGTDVPGQALVTYHADCFPLLFADPEHGVVAAAHAGWRGSLAGVATKTVQALHLAYGTEPEDLQVLVGPGICGRCYQVGPEIADQFEARYGRRDRYVVTKGPDLRLDLEAVTRLQLEDDGVPSGQIRSAGWCTREQERWFSHRAGRQGRFLSVIIAS